LGVELAVPLDLRVFDGARQEGLGHGLVPLDERDELAEIVVGVGCVHGADLVEGLHGETGEGFRSCAGSSRDAVGEGLVGAKTGSIERNRGRGLGSGPAPSP
jgi:hypothetical protein